MNQNAEKLTEGVEIVLPAGSLASKLQVAEQDNRPLNVKLGFDPTAPDLHLGHFVVLKKIKEFQDLGHNIILIIGDFTAQIGDPTGKNKTRPSLSREDVEKNSKTYIDQLSKVLDVDRITIKNNSEWFKEMEMSKILELLSSYNVGRMLTRDDFTNRLKENSAIALHELIYPLLQGYDSLKIDADVEIGGTDQLFNMQVGRHVQEINEKPAQVVLCMPLLRGLDGEKKMSKSLNNYIGLKDDPKLIHEKILSLPNFLLEEYVRLVTNFSPNEKRVMFEQIEAGTGLAEIKEKIAQNVVEQLGEQVGF